MTACLRGISPGAAFSSGMQPGWRSTRLHLRVFSVSLPFSFSVSLFSQHLTSPSDLLFGGCRTETSHQFHTVMLIKHPRKNSLSFFLMAAGFMETKKLVCPGKKMKVKMRKIFIHRTVLQRKPAIMVPSTNWEKAKSDQHTTGVVIWPGRSACCCPSPAWCTLPCWEWGSESVTALNGSLWNCTVCYFIHIVPWMSVSHCNSLFAFWWVRFSNGKVLLWIHSLSISLMSCIFVIQPALVNSYSTTNK